MNDPLVIAGKEFSSRLMVGTGRHRSNEDMVRSVESAGAEIVTVAIRRLDLDNPAEKNILDYFDWDKYTILPNTAGCKTADEAVFTAQLAREVTGSDWIKLEVIPYAEYLLPDPVGTYEAAVRLIDDGFARNVGLSGRGIWRSSGLDRTAIFESKQDLKDAPLTHDDSEVGGRSVAEWDGRFFDVNADLESTRAPIIKGVSVNG